MARRTSFSVMFAAVAITSLIPWAGTPVQAQVIFEEDFNGVTGAGFWDFVASDGTVGTNGWDTGISGENAFAGATNRARAEGTAQGTTAGGVDGTGAGEIVVSSVTFNPIHEDFESAFGYPGGAFLEGTGAPDTQGFTPNWDDGIAGEGAFGGTFDGAILNGNMTADGIGGEAVLVVDDVDVTAGGWYAGLSFQSPPLDGANVLLNVGFDANGGTLDDWATFGGSNFSATEFVRTGTHSLKKFGYIWDGTPNVSGVYQDLDAEEGQVWEIHAYAGHLTGDSLLGTSNTMQMKIEFFDGGGAMINTSGVVILDGSSPRDVWNDPAPLQLTAPAGTAVARGVLLFDHPSGSEPGAAHVDDVSFTVVSGPAQSDVDLSQISLNADVMGIADGPSGEVLGSYQLRIEDSDGDRLYFAGPAPGSLTTVGGLLSTATEANAAGIDSNGVFNVNSSTYTVVVAFDNDVMPTWGTGGTLIADDVILTGSDTTGSAWYGGLFWNNLTFPVTDVNALEILADIKGNVADGEYELRIEGIAFNSNGIEEFFDDVSTTGAQTIVTYDMSTTGVFGGFTGDWDTGILGEAAFGGIGQGTTLCSPSECPGLEDVGIFARGIASGGFDGGPAGEITVNGIFVLPPGQDWDGGLFWAGQALASTDLSQVELRAKVKGSWLGAWGQFPGDVELRIEDAQGDRRFMTTTVTGSWQDLGGTLDMFTEGGRAGGGGDGSFNLDSLNYTVVVAFSDPFATWGFGGTIAVDNIFLTPADVAVEVGRISYAGNADGSTFQTVGGMLTEGESTFVDDLTEDFEGAAGDSVQFWPGDWYYEDWDSGIEGEAAFGGTWGGGGIAGLTAQGCTTCGFPDGGGAQLIIEGASAARWSGGWWAGLVFPDMPADLSGDLCDVMFTAKVKGEPGPGGQFGEYILRLEDPDVDHYAFFITADGTWQDVGGRLCDGMEGGISEPQSDGIFNPFAGVYNAALLAVGPSSDPSTDWLGGGTLTIDDVFLSRPGRGFDDAESYTITVAFANELATWGTDGQLIVDNLLVRAVTPCDSAAVCPDADVNCDDVADGFDIAAIRQGTNWLLATVDAAEPRADVNGDGVVDGFDIAAIRIGTCWLQ